MATLSEEAVRACKNLNELKALAVLPLAPFTMRYLSGGELPCTWSETFAEDGTFKRDFNTAWTTTTCEGIFAYNPETKTATVYYTPAQVMVVTTLT
jgi:hypothetical protein